MCVKLNQTMHLYLKYDNKKIERDKKSLQLEIHLCIVRLSL